MNRLPTRAWLSSSWTGPARKGTNRTMKPPAMNSAASSTPPITASRNPLGVTFQGRRSPVIRTAIELPAM